MTALAEVRLRHLAEVRLFHVRRFLRQVSVMRVFPFFVLMVALLVGSARAAQGDWSEVAALPIPAAYPYVFPHQCLIRTACAMGASYEALSDIPVFAKERGRGDPEFKIANGDSFVVQDANVHVLRPGVIVAGWPTRLDGDGTTLARGDTAYYAYVLRYPNWVLAWAKGRFTMILVQYPWTSEAWAGWGRVVERPKLEQWALIKTRGGDTGWARLSEQNVNIRAYMFQR